MTDERRERYAAAFQQDERGCLADLDDAGNRAALADAAMAVADEELKELRGAGALMGKALYDAHQEIARLRATIERVRAAAEKAWSSWNTGDIADLIRAAREGES